MRIYFSPYLQLADTYELHERVKSHFRERQDNTRVGVLQKSPGVHVGEKIIRLRNPLTHKIRWKPPVIIFFFSFHRDTRFDAR